MAGTIRGGKKTAATLKQRDPDYYRKLGAIGGKATGLKGFALNPELARAAGAKGGRTSRRGKKYEDRSDTTEGLRPGTDGRVQAMGRQARHSLGAFLRGKR